MKSVKHLAGTPAAQTTAAILAALDEPELPAWRREWRLLRRPSEPLRKWLRLVEHATNAVEDAMAAAYCIEMPPPPKAPEPDRGSPA